MGKRGSQARGWDTGEGRQGPEGLGLTAPLALGAARSLDSLSFSPPFLFCNSSRLAGLQLRENVQEFLSALTR